MSTFVSDDPKWDGYRQSFAKEKGMGKYMGKGVFKVNKRGQYMTEG